MRRPTICICSSYSRSFSDIGDQASRTLMRYAHAFDYDVEVSIDPPFDRHPAWHRVKLIPDLFLKGYDYVLWVDADAYFARFDVDICSLIIDDSDMYLVRHISQEFRGTYVPNTGVMLVKSSDWSKELFTCLWSMTTYENHKWWDNAAFIKLLGYNSLLGEGPDLVNESISKHINFIPDNWNFIPGLSLSVDPIIIHYAGYDNDIRRLLIQRAVSRVLGEGKI